MQILGLGSIFAPYIKKVINPEGPDKDFDIFDNWHPTDEERIKLLELGRKKKL